MRTKHTVNNITYSFLNNFIVILLKFVIQAIFIRTLGIEYLGFNSFMVNIITMLSLAELGFGTAISFSLYEPLKNNNQAEISDIMIFFKGVYYKIAILTFLIGIIMMFLIPLFINLNNIDINIYIVFTLFLLTNLNSYIFGYKRTLIIADQKNYKIMPHIIVFNFLISVSQIAALLFFESYILFLLMILIFRTIENLVINKYIDKKYPYIKYGQKHNLNKDKVQSIKTNVKGMMYQKFADLAINSTDNIIIGMFLSLAIVGIYSNYLLIISSIFTFMLLFFNSITASLGNLLTEKNIEKKILIFEQLNFITLWLMFVSGALLFDLLNPFISWWLKDQTLIFSVSLVFVLVLNYFLTGTRHPLLTLKMASGTYDKDKYVPLIQAVTNLILTIVLVNIYGLIGVFIGTMISSFVVIFLRPKILYREIFNQGSSNYIIKYFLNTGFFIISILLINIINNYIFLENDLLSIVFRSLSAFMISNLILFIVFFKSSIFKSVSERIEFMVRGKTV